MRRQLVTAIALTFVAASTASAQTCPNSVGVRYPLSIQTRAVYRPTVQIEQIQFGAQQHLPELAAVLYEQSNAVCWEMHHNYQDNIGFQQTYAAMYKIMQDTKHVFDLVQRSSTPGGDEDHIAADLHAMDALFHRIEDDIARWRPSRQSYYRPGTGLGTKMTRFGESLHRLMNDYGIRCRGAEAPAPQQTLQAPPPTVPLPPTNYQPVPQTPELPSTFSASPILPLDGTNPRPLYDN